MRPSHCIRIIALVAVGTCALALLAACGPASVSAPASGQGGAWGASLNGPVTKLVSVADDGVVAVGGSEVVRFDATGAVVWRYDRPGTRITDAWSDLEGRTVLLSYEATQGVPSRGLDCVVAGERSWSRVSTDTDLVPLGRISADGSSALVVELPINKRDGALTVSAVNAADGSVAWTKSFAGAANGFFASSPDLGRVLVTCISAPEAEEPAGDHVVGLEAGRVVFDVPASEEQAPFPAFVDNDHVLLGEGTRVSVFSWTPSGLSDALWSRPVEWASDVLVGSAGIGVMTYGSGGDLFQTSCTLFTADGSFVASGGVEGPSAYTFVLSPTGRSFVAVAHNWSKGLPGLSGSLGVLGTQTFAEGASAALYRGEKVLVGRADGALREFAAPR